MRKTHIKYHFEITRKALHQDPIFFLITEPHYLHLKLTEEQVMKGQENWVVSMILQAHIALYIWLRNLQLLLLGRSSNNTFFFPADYFAYPSCCRKVEENLDFYNDYVSSGFIEKVWGVLCSTGDRSFWAAPALKDSCLWASRLPAGQPC